MSYSSRPDSPAEISLSPIVTSVVWLVFTAAGVAGLRLQYQQAQARAKEPPPIIAEQMDVKMIGSAQTLAPIQNPPENTAAAAETPPQAPTVPAVAEPSPEIPLVMPINAPVQRSAAVAATPPPVEHLTFGTGQGDKPAPEYPREAKIAHQQGTVVVRFTVDEDGHVTSAKLQSACPYELLNQAAVRAVRDTWDHFPAGKPRLYDVLFQFKLYQQ